jgi:hypothetical protein
MPIRYTAEERYDLAIERGILVDPQDEWLLYAYTWHLNRAGYAYTNILTGNGNEHIYTALHHCIIGYPIWKGDDVDHINRCKADDRRENLRFVTRSENIVNAQRNDEAFNITERPSGRYQVRVGRDNFRHHIGVYDTIEEAEQARDTWLHNHDEDNMQ